MIRRGGVSVIEMLVVLSLLGILLGMIAPGAVRWRDAAAVRGARDELAAGLAWTRLAAAAHGGASLVMDPAAARYWITMRDGATRRAVDLFDRYGVTLETGTTDTLALEYDALGIGRVTSRTLRLRRGSAEGGLVVSGHGRFRRW